MVHWLNVDTMVLVFGVSDNIHSLYLQHGVRMTECGVTVLKLS